MELADVARRLGMVRSPAQEAYRQLRRQGCDQRTARQLTPQAARSLAVAQTQAVLSFIRDYAVWTIPDDAWPVAAGTKSPRHR